MLQPAIKGCSQIKAIILIVFEGAAPRHDLYSEFAVIVRVGLGEPLEGPKQLRVGLREDFHRDFSNFFSNLHAKGTDLRVNAELLLRERYQSPPILALCNELTFQEIGYFVSDEGFDWLGPPVVQEHLADFLQGQLLLLNNWGT